MKTCAEQARRLLDEIKDNNYSGLNADYVKKLFEPCSDLPKPESEFDKKLNEFREFAKQVAPHSRVHMAIDLLKLNDN